MIMSGSSNYSIGPPNGTAGLTEDSSRTYSRDEIEAIHGLHLLQYQKLREICAEKARKRLPMRQLLAAVQFLERSLNIPKVSLLGTMNTLSANRPLGNGD